MSTKFQQLFQTLAPAAVILIRLMVGGVFLSEEIQKFLYPAELAAGRFAKIGIPAPEVMGPFVGGVEGVCGTLVLLGLGTRVAVVPLIFAMLGGDGFDQDSGASGARILGLFPASVAALWILVHVA